MTGEEIGRLGVMELIQAAEAVKAAGPSTAVADLYRGWIARNADAPLLYAVLFNLGVVLGDMDDLAGAQASLERAIALNPDFLPPYINLGRILERQGAAGAAVSRWSEVVDRLAGLSGSALAHKTTALNQMARVLEDNAQDAAAEALLRQSIELDRDQREAIQHFLALRQRQCTWPVVTPLERCGRETLISAMSPLSLAAYTDDPLFQLAAAAHYNLHDVGVAEGDVVRSHWAAREAGGTRLRIGYLSSDLRQHAVGYLMSEVFELHDRGEVETFAYACGRPGEDALTARFRASADHFVPIHDLSDAEAARRMADDGIQILVDVNGYTREGRTRLIALRPAPVIVNWLGYPGTLGSPYHHYIIADDWIIPPESEVFYSEAVRRLPCYQPTDRRRAVADTRPGRAEAGLPEAGTVFCCFNGAHKITRFTFERWMTILERVPGSVLWLLDGASATNDRLRALAHGRGVDPGRLVFAPKLANAAHLARYPLADLFLDTTPYGAHTTASDALWMGVPVLTWSGRSFASRVCGSLVRAAGLADLVCASASEYVDRAVALGRDAGRLARLRERLAAGRETCTLFDTPGLVRELEGLYRGMWREYEAGALPRPDLANLEVVLEVGRSIDHEATELQALADYRGGWRDRLARRDALRPIARVGRLWPPGGWAGQ